ncbi:MAG: ThiF family adenylyltransferase, partial [Prevotellaceae bacterium]|nr:ThiF family adenylyltransferase [Prevotellaceae bacterium]
MGLEQGFFKRTELLLGSELMQRIATVRVIVFGVGGVGSWCVESLVRSGIKHITLVDSDRICVTNINRQLMATYKTVGQVKVEMLKQRMLEINPKVEITALQQIYSAETADSFHIETYDYIIDAIDSLENKALLIKEACKTKARLFSSMGAALRIDPLRVQAAEFWKVQGCSLAAALRRKFKKTNDFPAK